MSKTGGTAPLLRRRIFEPLYFARNNSRRLAYWRKIEKSQYWEKSRLLEVQWQRLNELLCFVYENNSFYQSRFAAAGIQPGDIRTLEDFYNLPILTKAEIRLNTTAMISARFRQENLLHFKTGGSTGKSLEFYITEECSELRNACARRHDRWTGWEPGEVIGALWGNPKRPKTLREKIIDLLVQPVIYLDTMEFSDASVRQFALEWDVYNPTLLFGHAHSIFMLAVHVKRLGIEKIRPHGILTTSMMLLPHERVVIEDVFRVKVFDRYGCEEVGLIAAECEKHEGMHINIEHLIVEFIKDDGSVAGPGETGNIIVTDLMNYAMPFIRYRIEDVGAPSVRLCSCGRGLPLMHSIGGRVADFLIKSDGSKVAGVSLIENSLTKFPGIDQMQIVQMAFKSISLNIVKGISFTGQTQEALVTYFKNIFGQDTDIDLVFLDQICPERSGKYRFSICRIKGSP